MEKIGNIELIPVIELVPLDFSETRIYDGPDAQKHIELWDAYNRKSYADSSLTKVSPIEIGSWLFKIEDLDINELSIIIKRKLEVCSEDYDSIQPIFDDPIEYAPLVAGGFLFISNDKVLSKPGCCAGLETIYDWNNAANGIFGEIWTGHDKKGIVKLTKVEKDSIFQMTIDDNLMLIDIKDLRQAVDEAKLKIDKFIHQVGTCINQIFKVKNGHEVAKSMIYK